MIIIEELYTLFLNCNRTVCTDTRKITKGSLFIALKGDNFNGNLFAEKALTLGAKYAIADEKHCEHEHIIIVENALKALQSLANHHRKQCKALVLGIGGSNGKTTTKELVSSVLSQQYNIQFTKGNLNNHIGVPFTLLDLKDDCEIAVVELGANHIGDIEELCDIAEPDLGIITNIGKEHLEGFGSLEGVAKAESELFDFLIEHNGIAFVNNDDKWIHNMSNRLPNKRTYSIYSSGADTYITAEKIVPTIKVNYKNSIINAHLMGEHNLQNITAAIAIAEYFGISKENIASGISNYIPQNNRSQIIETSNGNTILLDAYNANPSSVEQAIKTFVNMKNKPQLILIGDMFELGAHAADEHLAIAELCASYPSIESILVGHEFYKISMKQPHIMLFQDKHQAIEILKNKAVKNYNVLIKGSRGMKMEEFTEVF